MAKKININTVKELNEIISNLTKEVINENFSDSNNNRILLFLENLCEKMGASFAEYDEENERYVIVSSSMLDLKYIFEPDPENMVKLVEIEGLDEFKQAFNEISILRHVMEGKKLTKID